MNIHTSCITAVTNLIYRQVWWGMLYKIWSESLVLRRRNQSMPAMPQHSTGRAQFTMAVIESGMLNKILSYNRNRDSCCFWGWCGDLRLACEGGMHEWVMEAWASVASGIEWMSKGSVDCGDGTALWRLSRRHASDRKRLPETTTSTYLVWNGVLCDVCFYKFNTFWGWCRDLK